MVIYNININKPINSWTFLRFVFKLTATILTIKDELYDYSKLHINITFFSKNYEQEKSCRDFGS